MKTLEQIQERADQVAYNHFHCESGEVWETFEQFSENQLEEWQEILSSVIEDAMVWAQNILGDYIVLYTDNAWIDGHDPFGFYCEAEDDDHAREQCMNAYPHCIIVAVYPTDTLAQALSNFADDGGQDRLNNPFNDAG